MRAVERRGGREVRKKHSGGMKRGKRSKEETW